MPLTLSPAALRDARVAAGVTQADAAAAVGVALSTLRAAEAGATEPRASMVARLARLYGVAPDELFHDDTPGGAA